MDTWRATGDEAVREALRTAYPRAASFRLCKPERGAVAFECSVLQLDEFAVRKTACTGYQAASRATETVRINLPLSAGVAISTTQHELFAVAEVSGFALCADETVGRKVLPAYNGFYVEFSKEQIARQAQHLIGRRPNVGKIAVSLDLRDPLPLTLLGTIASTFRDARVLGNTGLADLLKASQSELILRLAATAVLPSLRDELTQTRKSAGSSIAERAHELLEARVREPIRISVLAQELGVSLRALELGFLKRYGCTPSKALRDNRLGLARHKLLTAVPATTVTEVAVSSGFGNPGAFAARYRAAFGELPSQTLKRVK